MFNYLKSKILFLSLLFATTSIVYSDVVEKNYSIKYNRYLEWITLSFKIKADNINNNYVYVYADDLKIGMFSGKDAEINNNGDIIIEYKEESFTKAELIKFYAKCKKGDIKNINFYNNSFDSKPAVSIPISQFPNFVNNFIKEFDKL